MSFLQFSVSGVILVSTLLGVGGFNGYYSFYIRHCHYTQKNISGVEFIYSAWFNKAEYLQFNTTVGKWVGYTEFGVKNAEEWNKDKGIMAMVKAERDRVCIANAQLHIDAILSKKAEPEVRLTMGKPSTSGHPALLMCSAYNFYPKLIRVTWHRDGQEVKGDVISSEELADGDWYYQTHSHLEFTPKAGEKISCVVEHISLRDPLEITWDPSMPEPERNKIAIGAAALVLGLIVTAAGFIYYKTKSRGRILVPSG